MKPLIIGVSGKIGAGKDAVADRLVDNWQFTKLSFSKALHRELQERFPRMLGELAKIYETTVGALLTEKPRKPVVRALFQEYGTAVRRADDASYWTMKWHLSVDWTKEDQRIVVPDVRFENEAKLVKSLGGYIVKVTRSSLEAHDTHVSEEFVDTYENFDYVIANDGTPSDLHAWLDSWAVGIVAKHRRIHKPFDSL